MAVSNFTAKEPLPSNFRLIPNLERIVVELYFELFDLVSSVRSTFFFWQRTTHHYRWSPEYKISTNRLRWCPCVLFWSMQKYRGLWQTEYCFDDTLSVHLYDCFHDIIDFIALIATCAVWYWSYLSIFNLLQHTYGLELQDSLHTL